METRAATDTHCIPFEAKKKRFAEYFDAILINPLGNCEDFRRKKSQFTPKIPLNCFAIHNDEFVFFER